MNKILIIEDEILIQQSLKKLLEKKGAIVETTASGHEGLKMLLENNYDRIITDLMLKDITGFDIIEDSKSKYSSDEIKEKFIIITAYSSEQVLKKAQKYQCQVISKPFKDIIGTIDLFLENL